MNHIGPSYLYSDIKTDFLQKFYIFVQRIPKSRSTLLHNQKNKTKQINKTKSKQTNKNTHTHTHKTNTHQKKKNKKKKKTNKQKKKQKNKTKQKTNKQTNKQKTKQNKTKNPKQNKQKTIRTNQTVFKQRQRTHTHTNKNKNTKLWLKRKTLPFTVRWGGWGCGLMQIKNFEKIFSEPQTKFPLTVSLFLPWTTIAKSPREKHVNKFLLEKRSIFSPSPMKIRILHQTRGDGTLSQSTLSCVSELCSWLKLLVMLDWFIFRGRHKRTRDLWPGDSTRGV